MTVPTIIRVDLAAQPPIEGLAMTVPTCPICNLPSYAAESDDLDRHLAALRAACQDGSEG